MSTPLSGAMSEVQETFVSKDGSLPLRDQQSLSRRSSSDFWRNRFFEAGLILSMVLYYVTANPHIPYGLLAKQNPLVSLPFLVIFAILCWFRLPFALALLPLSLPYYRPQKVIFGNTAFSLVEITLYLCLTIALLQFLTHRALRSRLSWSQLRNFLGPFVLPMLIFFCMAAVSVGVAYSQPKGIVHFAAAAASRTFRQEVIGPFLYVLLAFLFLRSRSDLKRLCAALFGCGLIIALLGMAQFFFFKSTLVKEVDGLRVHAVYGSANSIGLLFDYALPIGLAMLFARMVSWRNRLLLLITCGPLFYVLYLTQSRGAQFAIGCALLLIIIFSIRNRRVLLVGSALLVVLLVAGGLVFQKQITDYFVNGHTNASGVSTLDRRIYLWQSALNMIHNSPWLGYGMDNWLCHYSKNDVCPGPAYHYWITVNPANGKPTGLTDEPDLSHPHNAFLHVWVSMGVFGMLAFGAILILYFWLFAGILRRLKKTPFEGSEMVRWMTLGVGAAMLAAMIQGQVDSAFLEQDLSFCFWTLVGALLILRMLSGTRWRDLLTQRR